MNSERIYFPGLNSIRAIGALTVIIGHVDILRKDFGFCNHSDIAFFKNTSGHLGVVLFFVLSGFLITYLLLYEKDKFQNIELKDFYVRRILRIWPLYYLMTVIAFVILPLLLISYPGRTLEHYVAKFSLYLFFLPNISFAFLGAISGAFHLWSIGVEEQFYLMWPLIIQKFRAKILYVLIIIFILISLLPHIVDWGFSHFAAHIFSDRSQAVYLHESITHFFFGFKINSMALGGIGAYLYHTKKRKLLNIIYHPITEVSSFSVATLLWASGTSFKYFNDEIYSLLFIFVILNVATNANPFFSLRIKLLDFLGTISYGLYVYHWMIIMLLFLALKQTYLPYQLSMIESDVLFYLLSIGTTILVSYVSFHYFEKRILRFKSRFTKVASGSE